MVVLDAASEDPYYDVRPQARATRDGRSVDGGIASFGNVFYLSLPNPYPDRWQVQLELAGGLGAASTRFRLHGVDPASFEDAGVMSAGRRTELHRVSAWWIGGIVLAVVAVAAFVAIRRRS
jgi:hypothetical protein